MPPLSCAFDGESLRIWRRFFCDGHHMRGTRMKAVPPTVMRLLDPGGSVLERGPNHDGLGLISR